MTINKQLQIFIFTIIIVYIGASVIPRHYARPEIYPFFSWDLFSDIPNEVVDYGLKLTAINRQELEPHIYFEEAEQWIPDSHSIIARANILELGHAVVSQDEAQIEIKKMHVESIHLQHLNSATYIVVHRRYNPLDRWRTGKVLEETDLRIFTLGE